MPQKINTARTTDTANGKTHVALARNHSALNTAENEQAQLLQLQHQYGNEGVQHLYKSGLLQARLKIGKAGDKYEREADRVADRVMSMPEPLVARQEGDDKEEIQAKPLAESITPLVQRQEEEEEAQAKLLQRQEEEEEAQPKLLQRQEEEEEEEEVQPKLLQRQEEEEEAQPKLLQRQEEEEEAQPKLLQRQEEEEEAQAKLLQRQEEEEEAQPKLLQRQEKEEEVQPKLLQRQEEEEEAQPKLVQCQEEEEEAQPKLLQRQEEEEEVQPKLLQRQEELQAKFIQRSKVTVKIKNERTSEEFPGESGNQLETKSNFNKTVLGKRIKDNVFDNLYKPEGMPTGRTQFTCAEPHAFSQFIDAERGATPKEVIEDLKKATVSDPQDKNGYKPPCRWCSQWVGGVEGGHRLKSRIRPQLSWMKARESSLYSAPQLKRIQQKASAPPSVTSSFESTLNSSKGSGKPMDSGLSEDMGARFGTDFSGVRIHTDARAADMSSQIQAQAFTSGKDIYFNSGHYNPSSEGGKKLLAHELTHTIQQGATPRKKAVQKKEIAQKKSEVQVQSQKVAERTGGIRVQGGWLGSAVSWVADKAKSAGSAIVEGAKAVGSAAMNFLAKAKEKAIGAVRKHPGYALVASISGKDPITGKAIPPQQGGILKFLCNMVGAGDIYDKIVKANIVGRIVGIVKSSLAKSKITWSFVKSSLKAIWNTVSINPLTWGKAAVMVKNLFVTLFKNALAVGKSLVKKLPPVILEGFLILVGAPVKTIMGVLKKGANTITTIVKNPMKFVGNLVTALKKGFFQFKGNIWKHLKAGLMGWLMGAMEGAGIQLPEKWDLKGIIHLVLQVLGLTYTRIRQKVVKKIGPKGEQVVSTMEKTVTFVKDLLTRGPMAMWEKIKEKAADIKNAVIDGIKNWIITKIVTAAITKLVSMCNPAGAIIQAVLAIYNTIMFFIERAKQIAALVSAVINSVASIASGKIAAAANWIEQSMAKTIPVIISFLARLIGLGGISAKIKAVIDKIRKPIDKVVDKVVGFIVDKGKSLLGKGKAMVKKGAEKIKSFLFPEKKFSAGSEKHRIWVKDGPRPVLMVSSDPHPVDSFLSNAKTDPNISDARKAKIPNAQAKLGEIKPLLDKAAKAKESNKPQSEITAINQQILAKEQELALLLSSIMDRKKKLDPKEKSKLEGLVATYSAMPRVTGDNLTPDHQPQAKSLKYVASLDVFKGTKAVEIAGGSHASGGLCINIEDKRHKAGRTWGSKGKTTGDEAKKDIDSKVSKVTGKEAKQDAALGVLKNHLSLDVAAMKAVANNDANYQDVNAISSWSADDKKMAISRIKKQINEGEDRIASQDLNRFKQSS